MASIFTSGAALQRRRPLNLDVVGGANSLTFANASGDFVSLYGTAGAIDAVTRSANVDLLRRASHIAGAAPISSHSRRTGDVVALAGTGSDWDSRRARTGRSISRAPRPRCRRRRRGSFASGRETEQPVQTARTGTRPRRRTRSLSHQRADPRSPAAAIRSISPAVPAISRASTRPERIGTTSSVRARSSISSIPAPRVRRRRHDQLMGGTDDRLSLYATAGAWNSVTGVGSTIYLGDAQSLDHRRRRHIRAIGATGNAASLYNTGGDWDRSWPRPRRCISPTPRPPVRRRRCPRFRRRTGRRVSLYNTAGTADAITGSLGRSISPARNLRRRRRRHDRFRRRFGEQRDALGHAAREHRERVWRSGRARGFPGDRQRVE